MPWSTSFEERFCDYTQLGGDCYGDTPFKLTDEYAHSGRFSAEFTVSSASGSSHQTRCIRRGVLPDSAYYGAWYYIPSAPTPPCKDCPGVLWNLFHFQTPELLHTWDVTLVPDSKGNWDLQVYDAINGKTFQGPDPTPIPIGAWFHIVFFLKRAPDATGAIGLYLGTDRDGGTNDVTLAEVKNLKSDHSKYTEWYVGNLGERLQPPDSTLYVDDVSISATR